LKKPRLDLETGYKPLGLWPGIWGLIVCLIHYMVVSLLTIAPHKKAEDYIGYIEKDLAKYKFL
jgi:SSS family solute:Na+ symporter